MIRIFRAFALLISILAFPSIATTNAHSAELLMFDSPICEWCDKWREEIGSVYPKTEEGRIAPLRTINIHRARPAPYETVKGIVYTPTFVLWHDGREVGILALEEGVVGVLLRGGDVGLRLRHGGGDLVDAVGGLHLPLRLALPLLVVGFL